MTLLDLIRAFAVDEASRLDTDAHNQASALALARYSTDRPLAYMREVLARPDGHLPLPEDWQPGFSRVLSVGLPIGPPHATQVLPNDDWCVAHASANEAVINLHRPIGGGDKAIVVFTAAHTAESIPLVDLEAVAHYGAAILLEQLAVIYSGDRQSTIESDSVEHQAKGSSYAARANEQRKLYLDHMGIDPKRTVSAGALISVGKGRLLHGAPKARRRAW